MIPILRVNAKLHDSDVTRGERELRVIVRRHGVVAAEVAKNTNVNLAWKIEVSTVIPLADFSCEVVNLKKNHLRSQPVPRGVLENLFSTSYGKSKVRRELPFLHIEPEILVLFVNEKAHGSEVILVVESAELREGCAKYYAISSTEARERAS